MNQDLHLTQTLAEAQEQHVRDTAVVFTLYTESKPNLSELVTRYFDGATITYGLGLWQGTTEPAAVIQIFGWLENLQNIVFLAGDIKTVNAQQTVLITWHAVTRLDV